LSAALLLRGSVSFPKRFYHLEISGLTRTQAEGVVAAWKGLGWRGGTYRRRGSWVSFLKNGEWIARFLNLLGAHQSLLRFEEIRALKETKNEVRRHVNYESANLGRTVKAALRQKEIVEELARKRKWESLPRSLKTVALARLKYPERSLAELAQKLNLTKSALYHRWRRLSECAG